MNKVIHPAGAIDFGARQLNLHMEFARELRCESQARLGVGSNQRPVLVWHTGGSFFVFNYLGNIAFL